MEKTSNRNNTEQLFLEQYSAILLLHAQAILFIMYDLEGAFERVHEFRRQFNIGLVGIFGEVGRSGLEHFLSQGLGGFPGVERVGVVLYYIGVIHVSECVSMRLGGKRKGVEGFKCKRILAREKSKAVFTLLLKRGTCTTRVLHCMHMPA